MGKHSDNIEDRAKDDGGYQKGATHRGKELDKHGNLVPKKPYGSGGKHAKPEDGGEKK